MHVNGKQMLLILSENFRNLIFTAPVKQKRLDKICLNLFESNWRNRQTCFRDLLLSVPWNTSIARLYNRSEEIITLFSALLFPRKQNHLIFGEEKKQRGWIDTFTILAFTSIFQILGVWWKSFPLLEALSPFH